MELEQLFALLGRPSTDPLVEQTLTQLRISRRPQIERDEGDIDGPVVETQDWLINRRVGVEFGFEDEASFVGGRTADYGVGPMLLTQLYFYGCHEGVEPYPGSLPFELQIEDDRDTVRTKLRMWDGTRRSYLRDTWELPEFRMTISYVDDGHRVGFMLVMLPRPSKPRIHDDMAQLPTIDRILDVLGKPFNDSALQAIFAPLGVRRRFVDRGGVAIAEFRDSYGLELRFSGEGGRLVFSNALFYRDREMEACGWPGSLPFGLAFDDSPEVLFRKMDAPPNESTEDTFVGYAVWHISDYSIQVRYSMMENWILCVHVMAPGVWDAY